MIRLEDITPGTPLHGILPHAVVTAVNITWYGHDALELIYRTAAGQVATVLLYRSDEATIALVQAGAPWGFDGDGALFRLIAEAHRIHLAHLFDPVLAVHTALVEPLPHQITAVYETMLTRQPLRFLLADDPGAGKTIMAGLLIKELIARGDLRRCLVVCPGSLAEQWQDELRDRFHLTFAILTNDQLEAAASGNWFLEHDLVIARLDKLARDTDVQALLRVPAAHWDLVICDEAHKLAATFTGGEISRTHRYRLGELLGTLTRHLLLLTATPHSGKEADFQLFLALLDPDRFAGKFRDGVHQVDASDLMRRMVKEQLLTFAGTPLFPERIAYTVSYPLAPAEADLYRAVTTYVREEFNRAESLQNNKRTTVGFALTILQRRLASSPEALLQSLHRRRTRLEHQLTELEQVGHAAFAELDSLDADMLDDLDEANATELEAAEQEILDQATAARTLDELRRELETLRALEQQALALRRSGEDRKWQELANVLTAIFLPSTVAHQLAETSPPYATIPPPVASPHQKLVIFTEHRDTLTYLVENVRGLLGRAEAVVTIHGSMRREDRLKAQEAFRHAPDVQVLIATDAAGEGINLQRAHLMVNYDLPWNPNRIEQRFGRIHRIGQAEVCYLWNLVAHDTREGDVYATLLRKLDQARTALGGRVFDVLGKLQFDGLPLRDLLIEAIRYGEQPEVRARLSRVVDSAVDQERLRDLLEERALAHDAMDARRVARVRADLERAEARRLQPHYIEAFFLRAFRELGGTLHEREPRRYQITHVPAILRQQPRTARTAPVLGQYERIVFEKALIQPPSQPRAAFVCPGHPLLDATLAVLLEQHASLLRQGAVLVDERDPAVLPRLLFLLEHRLTDASLTASGEPRTVSQQLLYVELRPDGTAHTLSYAPYLDYRPLAPNELDLALLRAHPALQWVSPALEQQAVAYAIAHAVPAHLEEVRTRRLEQVRRTRAAVKDRLSKEIYYWDRRANELKEQERAGKPNARLNSQQARSRADELESRLQDRLLQLEQEEQINPLPPVVRGGVLVLPAGLLAQFAPAAPAAPATANDTQAIAARARAIVMEYERSRGYLPVDREFERLGYDIESSDPRTGALRLIEVKGRTADAETITVTRNEILTALNKPDSYRLAIVRFFPDNNHELFYICEPFGREPDFGATSVNYRIADLIARSGEA